MLYNRGPFNCDSFIDFIERGYYKQNNMMFQFESLSPFIIAFKNFIRYLEVLYLSTEDDPPTFEDANIEHVRLITTGDLKNPNFFSGVFLILSIPLITTTVLFRLSAEDKGLFDIELLRGSMINHVIFKESKYTKDIYFIRTTGDPTGEPVYIYKESRYHIYNLNFTDLDFEDIYLDQQICLKYLIDVFKDLIDEIVTNFNDFYYARIKEGGK